MGKPSEKQIAFAKSLSKRLDIDLPKDVLKDKEELSIWITQALEEKKKRGIDEWLSEKQEKIVEKYAPEDIKKAYMNNDIKTVKEWLDEWFKQIRSKDKEKEDV